VTETVKAGNCWHCAGRVVTCLLDASDGNYKGTCDECRRSVLLYGTVENARKAARSVNGVSAQPKPSSGRAPQPDGPKDEAPSGQLRRSDPKLAATIEERFGGV
jgi:hypothetical protein